MVDREQFQRIQRSVAEWNEWWRKEHRNVFVDLREADLSGADLRGVDLEGADLERADLGRANLATANLFTANLQKANFKGSRLYEASLYGADCRGAQLLGADLSRADLRAAYLQGADLERANLRRAELGGAVLYKANLNGADLRGANLSGADLSLANLVEADLRRADLTGCRIYGLSAWRLQLDEHTKQQSVIITPRGEPKITADDMEVAQFLYLLIHNEKIRRVIDTITSKVVLILGRFSKDHKVILDAMRDVLRKQNLLPVIFDFSIPAGRDVTEMVSVLAGIARFVIADITDATEVRVELHNIVRNFASLPVQPILLSGQSEFVSLSHLQKFPWLLPSFEYESLKHLLANLEKRVVSPAEAKVLELRRMG